MSEFQNLLQEELKDPEFKKEWDDMQPEMDVIRAMIDARIEQNLTQKELAKRTEIAYNILGIRILKGVRMSFLILLIIPNIFR